MKEIERVRWRCRRGMLELDILLSRFVDHHYAHMDEAQRMAFDVLLDMPDAVLWDMITGRTSASPAGDELAVLELIRTA
jgi:antitoxin CptB